MVTGMYNESWSSGEVNHGLLIRPYKSLLPQNFLMRQSFFSSTFFLSFFHFHHTLFRGLAGARVNPGRFFQTLFLYIHLFV